MRVENCEEILCELKEFVVSTMLRFSNRVNSIPSNKKLKFFNKATKEVGNEVEVTG
jgi:hypothetical protein